MHRWCAHPVISTVVRMSGGDRQRMALQCLEGMIEADSPYIFVVHSLNESMEQDVVDFKRNKVT